MKSDHFNRFAIEGNLMSLIIKSYQNIIEFKILVIFF